MSHPHKNMIFMNGDIKRSILSNLLSFNQPLLIEVPRTRLLLILLAHWMLMYFLIISTVWLLILFTIPFLAIQSAHYYGFAKVWKAHRYSLFLMHTFTFIVFCTAILTSGIVRRAVIELLSGW